MCLFSSYVMPGEQRTRSWLTSLYNKGTVIDSFVETNDKIPGEAPTLISENIQSLFYCSMKLTYWKFRMGRVLYLLYNEHLYVWSRHQNMDGFLYRTCTCKRKLTLCSVRLLILSSSPNNRASIWWLWFYSCFATLPLVVKDLLYTVHVHIHVWSCHDLCHSHTS